MVIKDMIFPNKIHIPENLKKKLVTFSNCDLTNKEMFMFSKAALYVEQQLIHECSNIDNIQGLVVFFTLNGELSLYEQCNTTCGIYFSMAVYIMERIRNKKDDIFTMFSFIEEMVHHFWGISDEFITKQKVEEIMKQLYPDFTLDYMRERWKLNGL